MRAGDDALLQDLLDERLDAEEASALRRRLETEPELGEAWQELRRIRDLVRGAPGERAPRDFLTRVRARIDAESPASALEEGAGTRLVFPLRLARAASALAALLFVALGVRWLVVDGETPVEDLLVVESAEAPPPAEWAPPSGQARSTPVRDAAPTPAPVAPVPPPPRAPGAFGPGDAVPPGLRTPHDAPPTPEGEAEPIRRASELKGRVARERGRRAPAAAHTWTLEAEDLVAGRARLALLVSGVRPDEDALESLRLGRAGDEVLGSALLSLSAVEIAALAPGRAADKSQPEEASERRDEEPERAKKAAVRVRVLFVRRAAER